MTPLVSSFEPSNPASSLTKFNGKPQCDGFYSSPLSLATNPEYPSNAPTPTVLIRTGKRPNLNLPDNSSKNATSKSLRPKQQPSLLRSPPTPPSKPLPILSKPKHSKLGHNSNMAELHKGFAKQLFVALSLEPSHEYSIDGHLPK